MGFIVGNPGLFLLHVLHALDSSGYLSAKTEAANHNCLSFLRYIVQG